MRRLLLLWLALLTGTARAGEPPAKGPAAAPTVEQVADQVLVAAKAGDAPGLAALAAQGDPDPWLVADELVGRAEPDAAAAFAAAAPRVDVEALPAYVARKRGTVAERELFARLSAALAAGAPQEVIETTEDLAPGPDGVPAIRLRQLRAQALNQVGRNPEALDLLLADAEVVAALGWHLRAAGLLQEAAFRAQDVGDTRQALALLTRTREIHRRRGDVKRAAGTLGNLGTLHYKLGELDRALPLFEQALAQLEALGDPGRGWVIANLGIVQRDLGRFEDALASFARAVPLLEAHGDRSQLAWALDELAFAHQRRGDPAAAIRTFESALALHEALGNARAAANTGSMLGTLYEKAGSLPKALAALEEARANMEQAGFKPGLPWILVQLGRLLRQQSKYPESLACLERARDVAEELGDRVSAVNVLTEISFVYQSMGRHELRIPILERVRDHHEAQGDKVNLSAAFINLGIAYGGLQERVRALELLDRGLALAREVGHPEALRSALEAGGHAFRDLGEHGRALASFQELLALRKNLGDEEGAAAAQFLIGSVHHVKADVAKALATYKDALARQQRLGNRVATSRTLSQMGLAYVDLGEYAKALALHEEALALKEASGDDADAAGTLINIGNVYSRLGDFAAAASHYERGLARARQAGQRQWALNALANLAVLKLKTGDPAGALAVFESTLPELEAQGNTVYLATALTNIGAAHAELGDYARALEAHERALEVGEKVGDRAGLPKTLINIAQAHAGLGHVEKALELYERGRREALSRRLTPDLVFALTERAVLRMRLGESAAALRDAREALEASEQLLGGLGDELGSAARTQHAKLYDVGALAAARENDVAELFHFLESGRAGALLDDLDNRDVLRWKAESLPADLQRLDQEAQARERDARAGLERAIQGRAIQGRGVQGGPGEPTRREATRALDEALEEVRQVAARIQREVKQQAGLFYPRARTLEEVQSLLEAEQALVLYALCWDAALALIITRDGARVVALGASADVIAACEGLDARRPDGEATQALDTLRERLVGPLHLGGAVKQVIVSPEGPLSYLPFGALFDRPVALAPSGTTHALLREEQSQPGREILAVGDPDYAGLEAGAQALYHRGRPLARLPATREEARRIGTRTLLGAEASEAKFRETVASATRWRAVHLACHGLVDPERPFLSSLALARSGEHDGFLTAREILWTKIPADLAVLSACETATGQIVPGEGIVGLTRAFMFAGAPRVICSLWKVDDEATAALMLKFYELWNPRGGEAAAGTPSERRESRGLPAAEALRQAQDFVRSQEPWKHPYYWAAWVLWGLP